MDLDDVARRIMEKYLRPAGHAPDPEIRIGDAVFLKLALECFQIVGAEGQMAFGDRVHILAHGEAKIVVLLGDVKLEIVVCQIGAGASIFVAAEALFALRNIQPAVNPRAGFK